MKQTETKLFPDLSEAFFLAELILIKKMIDEALAGDFPAYDILEYIHARTKRILKNETTT